VTANTYEGWRVEVLPGGTPCRTNAGRVRLPVRVMRSGEHVTDAEVIITGALVEQLYATLTLPLEQRRERRGD
jgi:hypothetical protein